ncbi:MAG TPA: HAD family phosphatase [Candidatus Acidoferrales bacterium]|nr:HAD family phosphatase [Candidatus Acidoferrales bacterium]
MQKYSVIVFDLGNVLLPFDYDKVIRGFDQIENGLGSKFADYYKNNYDVHRKFERGEYTVEQFTEIMLDVLEHKVSKETFYEIYSKIFEVNERLAAVLPILKKNYRLILLSNTNAIHKEHGWENYGFIRYFDKMVLSHEVGAVKPEEKIYRVVEAFTQKAPREHFYVDDISEYVSAAKKLGWTAIQFVGNENLFDEFTQKGIKWNDGIAG